MDRDVFPGEKFQPLGDFFFSGNEWFIFTAQPDNTFFAIGENPGLGQFLRFSIYGSDLDTALTATQRRKKVGTENRLDHVFDYSIKED
jgi:hypothetical protein